MPGKVQEGAFGKGFACLIETEAEICGGSIPFSRDSTQEGSWYLHHDHVKRLQGRFRAHPHRRRLIMSVVLGRHLLQWACGTPLRLTPEPGQGA